MWSPWPVDSCPSFPPAVGGPEAETQSARLGESWVSEPRPFPHYLLLPLLLLLFLLLRAVSESASCLGSVAARGARAQASSWAGIF